MKIKTRARDYILLHLLIFSYSLTGIFSKMASKYDFLSFKFIFFYSMVLFILFVYAVLWQQILKLMPLTTAYLNKAVVVVWGIIWGSLIFHEKITWNMILGSIIIVLGVCVVAKGDE